VFNGVMVAVIIDDGVCAVDATNVVDDGIFVFRNVKLLPVWREETRYSVLGKSATN